MGNFSEKKFIDLEGLQVYYNKLKPIFEGTDSSLLEILEKENTRYESLRANFETHAAETTGENGKFAEYNDIIDNFELVEGVETGTTGGDIIYNEIINAYGFAEEPLAGIAVTQPGGESGIVITNLDSRDITLYIRAGVSASEVGDLSQETLNTLVDMNNYDYTMLLAGSSVYKGYYSDITGDEYVGYRGYMLVRGYLNSENFTDVGYRYFRVPIA